MVTYVWFTVAKIQHTYHCEHHKNVTQASRDDTKQIGSDGREQCVFLVI